jgi:hypothetical protein
MYFFSDLQATLDYSGGRLTVALLPTTINYDVLQTIHAHLWTKSGLPLFYDSSKLGWGCKK